MEALAPVEVLHRGLRNGTGGKGVHEGGEGIALTFKFVGDTPASCSFMLSRHRIAPRGFDGGEAGALGVVRVNGNPIDTTEQQVLNFGDIVDFNTAGGGGFGQAAE